MRRKKVGIAIGTLSVCIALALCATIAPAMGAESASTAADITKNGEPDGDVQYPGKEYIVENYKKWEQITSDKAPQIRKFPNGQLVQRTPAEYECPHWMQQSWTIGYNTVYLDADNRGCNSCHADLNTTIAQMDYKHAVLNNDVLNTYTDVNQCITCHRDNDDEFGRLMHGIHFNKDINTKFAQQMGGTCESCHTATGDGKGMTLWDNTKYDAMQGVSKVENVQGDFKYTQDKVQKMDELYSYDFVHGYYDHMRYACSPAGLDIKLPQSMFDEWKLTIDGNVPKPYTIALPELVKEAEAAGVVVTKTSKMVCELNPIGGGGIGQTEITGIPVKWLIDKAGGYNEGTTGVRAIRADGSSKSGFQLPMMDNAYLVYKMGGEYLDARRGFPVTHWQEGVDAQIFSKQISGYTVTTDKLKDRVCGQVNPEKVHVNKPNATICDTPEGLIVKTKEAHTFEGYVDAFDEKVTSIEFSMDRGKTWTKYDLGDTDVRKWIWWTYTYTPPEKAAYCLSVRATTETGKTSYRAHEVMFNALDEIPSDDQIAQAATPPQPDKK
ncbi:MAG: molybdopterin-dependent oxidoreductase [Raoultibacter sp.]